MEVWEQKGGVGVVVLTALEELMPDGGVIEEIKLENESEKWTGGGCPSRRTLTQSIRFKDHWLCFFND